MSRAGKPRPLDIAILILKVVAFSASTLYVLLNFSGRQLIVAVPLLLYATASQIYLHIKRENMTIDAFRWLFAKVKGKD